MTNCQNSTKIYIIPDNIDYIYQILFIIDGVFFSLFLKLTTNLEDFLCLINV